MKMRVPRKNSKIENKLCLMDRIKSLTPCLPLFLSIVTACALIWSAYIAGENHKLAEEHYKQIVQPLLLAQVTNSPLDGKLGIFLKNEGIGPAIINYKAMTLDGRLSSPEKVLSQMTEEGVIIPRPS